MPEPLHAYYESALNLLERDTEKHRTRYANPKPWADVVSGVERTSFATNVVPARPLKLAMPNKRDKKDAENARIVHSALTSLTPADASDPRLWTYLTHVTCWTYMRARWNMNEKDEGQQQLNYIREHYFLSGNRAVVRNGIARLWWYGHLTHDESLADPYELTDVLLSQLDIAQQVVERSIGRAPAVRRGFLTFLMERRDELLVSGGKARDAIRHLAKQLHFVGGRAVLDLFDAEEVRQLLRSEHDLIR